MPLSKLLDPMLLSLADNFEANKPNSAVLIEPTEGEWESLREFLALQSAEGLLTYVGAGTPSWAVKLTPKGYQFYLPRIQAGRILNTVSK